MPRKSRTYQDYLELGLHLHSARDALSAAISKSNETLTKKQTAKLLRAAQELDKARCAIDAEYCRDACSYDVPPGMPRFPIYMRNWLERHPVERLRLEDEA